MGLENLGKLAKAGADKVGSGVKAGADKIGGGVKDKIGEINKDPIGYAVKKGKEGAIDAAGNSKTGQKIKEGVEDAKKVVKGVQAGARAIESVGTDVMADLELLKLAFDKEFWKRMIKRLIKAFLEALAALACVASCAFLPLAMVIGTVFVSVSFIAGGWGDSCPKADVPTAAMQRFITYYDAYVQAANGYKDSSGKDWDLGKTYSVVDENGSPTGEKEKYNKTTPEILAAIDYKETNIADQIPECYLKCTVITLTGPEIDPVCYHKCAIEAIRCRAGKIRIALQDANKNDMSPADIDPYRNIVYIGQWRKIDDLASKIWFLYEPFTDKYILEDYEGDIARFWRQLRTNILVAGWEAFKGLAKLPLLPFEKAMDVLNNFLGTNDVGAATFFRLTRPELIPLRPKTPGWGDENSGHIKEFVTYMKAAFPANPPDREEWEYVPGTLPETLTGTCKVFDSPKTGTAAPAPSTPSTPSPSTPAGPTTPTPGGTASTTACISVAFPNISDEAKYIAALNKFIGSGKPLSGKGALFLASGKASNINPALLVSLARKETQFGSVGSGTSKGSHNSFGRQAGGSQPHPSGSIYYKWNSWDDSLTGSDNISVYIKRVYIKGMGIKTIPDMMMEYAPPTQNDTATYINEIKQWITKINNNAGSAITCTP
ncbi:MAG: hypothetical protein WCP14_02520 [bacterium]